jgi:hypothetical protein
LAIGPGRNSAVAERPALRNIDPHATNYHFARITSH